VSNSQKQERKNMEQGEENIVERLEAATTALEKTLS